MTFLAVQYFHNYFLNGTNFGEIVLHVKYILIFQKKLSENFHIYEII